MLVVSSSLKDFEEQKKKRVGQLHYCPSCQLCCTLAQIPPSRELKSRAGRVHGSKWQKQRAAAVIFGDGEWTLKSTSCTFARSSYRSLWILNKQHTGEPRYNYPLWSTSLVSTMWIKINTLSGAMAFMFSLCSCKLVSRGGGGRPTKVVWKYQFSQCTIMKLLRESRKGKVSVD